MGSAIDDIFSQLEGGGTVTPPTGNGAGSAPYTQMRQETTAPAVGPDPTPDPPPVVRPPFADSSSNLGAIPVPEERADARPDETTIVGDLGWGEIPQVDRVFDVKLTEAMWPQNSIYDIYFQTVRDMTDVPLAHHHGALTAAIGACMGPDRWMTWGRQQVTANVYVMLLAASGAGRKSYGLSLVSDLLPPELINSTVPSSDVALLDIIKDQPHRLLKWDEVGTLFKKLGQESMHRIPQWLCSAFDRSTLEAQSRGSGRTVVRAPCLTILSATTEFGLLPSASIESRQELLHGGLLGRFWMIPAERDHTKLIPLPWPTPTLVGMQKWFRGLVDNGPHFDEVFEYTLGPAAREVFLAWQAKRGVKAPIAAIASAWERADLFVLKLAMIYHTAQGLAPAEPISENTLRCAINYVWCFLMPIHCVAAKRVAIVGNEEKIRQARDLLSDSKRGYRLEELREALQVPHKRLAEILACLQHKVHYEKWRVSRGRGKPYYVIVWGHKPIPAHAWQPDRRVQDGEDVPPPKSAQSNLTPPESALDALLETETDPYGD